MLLKKVSSSTKTNSAQDGSGTSQNTQDETTRSTEILQEENNSIENIQDDNEGVEIIQEERKKVSKNIQEGLRVLKNPDEKDKASENIQEEKRSSGKIQEEPSPTTMKNTLNSEPEQNLYSVFESLYESVLFKKPDLLTNEVFVNAMNEIKLMKIQINPVQFQKDLSQIDELLDKLYRIVQANFDKLDKENLAKILINVKDKLQSKKPEENVGKIGKILNEYINRETIMIVTEKIEKPKMGKFKRD